MNSPQSQDQLHAPRADIAIVSFAAENEAMHSRLRIVLVLFFVLSSVIVLAGYARDAEPTPAIAAQPADERVDINHASLEELLKVPGMTRTWAQRIVRFRPYRTKLDLVEEGVLPGDVYTRVKDYLIAHREKK